MGWCAAAGEVPIAGTGAALALDGLAWSALSSSGLRVPAQVPGDLRDTLPQCRTSPWRAPRRQSALSRYAGHPHLDLLQLLAVCCIRMWCTDLYSDTGACWL